MNTLTAIYTITQTRGGRGFRVNLVRMGESHVMFRDPLRARCVDYIERHARNGVEAALAYFNANPTDRPAMRADMRDRDARVRLALGMEEEDGFGDRVFTAPEIVEEHICRVCHEPVAEDEMDVDGNRPDLHYDCLPEFEAERAEWKRQDYIDRIAKDALDRAADIATDDAIDRAIARRRGVTL